MVCGVVCSAQPMQSSICLVECGSLKHLPEEELQEADVIVLEQGAGRRPFRVGLDAVLERRDVALGVVGHKCHSRPDVDDAFDAFGVIGG